MFKKYIYFKNKMKIYNIIPSQCRFWRKIFSRNDIDIAKISMVFGCFILLLVKYFESYLYEKERVDLLII